MIIIDLKKDHDHLRMPKDYWLIQDTSFSGILYLMGNDGTQLDLKGNETLIFNNNTIIIENAKHNNIR
jgi:hypothetical protein